MKHHCILFKVQRLEFAIGMYGVRPSIKPLLFRFDLYLSFSKSNELHKNKRKRNYDYEPKIFSTAWRNKTKAQGLGGVRWINIKWVVYHANFVDNQSHLTINTLVKEGKKIPLDPNTNEPWCHYNLIWQTHIDVEFHIRKAVTDGNPYP
jgi:hypothetical protein